MIRIGIDIMGGDFAPGSTIQGSLLARSTLSEEIEIFLIGDQSLIKGYAEKNNLDISGFPIIHTADAVDMGENPLKAFNYKPDASIFLGQRLLKTGELDGFCSAGNTGAILVGAMQIITPLPGIIRPAVAAVIPNVEGPGSILLDVGLNPDARPDVLYQYGLIGSIYSKLIHKIQDPSVTLLNIGIEEEKGNLVTRSAFQLMKDTTQFNFSGNLEANELFVSPHANVIVCDGFIGNVVLKEAEAFYKVISLKGIGNGYFEMFNFENFGGTPLLGVRGAILIGHGISNEKAIKNMILHTHRVIEAKLVDRLMEKLGN